MSELNAPKILVIEDETTQRILVKEYLEESGYVVRLADDGRRGLEMAAVLNPDLILLDLLLPSMDGYTLCERLKENPATADIPVILVTASREADVIERGFASGASDFVTKPVDWSYLADRVAHVLQQSGDIKRLTAEKQAREQEVHALRAAQDMTGVPVETEAAPAVEAMDPALIVSREEHEQALQAAHAAADERVRKIEAAARNQIDAANTRTANVSGSFWSLIGAMSERHIAMLSALDQLTSGEQDEQAPGSAGRDRPENAVQSLLSATRNMSQLSQSMTGTAGLNDSPVDLAHTVREFVSEVQPQCENLRIALTADIPEQAVTVNADHTRIRDLLHAMVTNAFRFCPQNGTVRVSLRANPEEPVQLVIEDNGIGMPSALVERLQQSTEYPGNTLSQQDRRVGFGIPMSTATMKMHGGTLEISSEVGTGTTVTATLPEHRKCQDGASTQKISLTEKRAERHEDTPASEQNAA